MHHPPAVCAKAQRLEQLLLRVEAGEPLEAVCDALGLHVTAAELAWWQTQYEAAGRSWEVFLDGRYGRPQKVHSGMREWLYARKRADATLTAPELARELEQQFQVTVSANHVNYLLRKVGLTGPSGRPGPREEESTAEEPPAEPEAPPAAPEGPAAEGLPVRPAEEGAEELGAPGEAAVQEHAGLFFLEGAKQSLGVGEVVEETVEQARTDYRKEHPQASFRMLGSEPETTWHKLDHLLYLPVLGLQRPRDLYTYQEAGLQVLYGFTYKYLPLEHFLGELTRLRVGQPLAQALSGCYQAAWYPGTEPVTLFTDWHVKPHWTKQPSHSGMVTMWGRVMPGTKQLFLNGPEGHLLGAWNYPIDAHFSGTLVDLETGLEEQWQRPIGCTVVDGEGNGLPLAERYTAVERDYLSLLGRQGDRRLEAFAVVGDWQPVVGDPTHEAVEAHWKKPAKAAAEPRRLVLMRRAGETDPTRVYAGRIPVHLRPAEVPPLYRQRWPAQERVIRQLVNGANLNTNYGYTARTVPNRTQQRRWEEAQAQVEGCERKFAEQQEAWQNRWAQLASLRQTYQQQQQEGAAEIETQRQEMEQRQQEGRPTRRCQQRQQRGWRWLEQLKTRFQRGRKRLLQDLLRRRERRRELRRQRAERQTAREAIDTTAQCQERDLEKDQIMLNLQGLLWSLHDGVRQHFLAPAWQRLELDTATQLIYRKPGRVHWKPDQIEVVLEPYRYPEQQRAMEESCRRFNAAQIRWRDGRRLYIHVEGEPGFQLGGSQKAGQT